MLCLWVRQTNKLKAISSMPCLKMLSSSFSKPSKPRKIKSHLLTLCPKNNRFMILPRLSFILTFQKAGFSSQEDSSCLKKKFWQNGKDSPKKKTSRKERKLAWFMILRVAEWLQDGGPNLKRTPLNQPLWNRNRTERIRLLKKNKREAWLNLSNNWRNWKMWKE